MVTRNTPTGVGRTSAGWPVVDNGPEHPHGRGEDGHSSSECSGHSGTPPRAWGGPSTLDPERPDGRNTPTGVGRTRPLREWTRPSSEHPHGRGEDRVRRSDSPPSIGTPPRAWGGPVPGRLGLLEVRNTPTGVGRTLMSTWTSSAATEHPHGRGEDSGDYAASAVHVGTPPRAWGGLRSGSGTRPPVGTPPRAWGGQKRGGSRRLPPRNTPTGVGRTSLSVSLSMTTKEHPHGRGEDKKGAAVDDCRPGTPPRAWGGRRSASRSP